MSCIFMEEHDSMELKERMRAAITAGITGDALGVPVESSTRQELSLCSVKNMLGYGRYDQPTGTWSDDTSMTLCTMESLIRGYDIHDIAQKFCRWLFEGYRTASGYVFDSGLTTFMALESITSGQCTALTSGKDSEDDNGNGSLMRILPAALYFRNEATETFLARIHEISAITHAHPRAQIACGIYSLLVRALLDEKGKEAAFQETVSLALQQYESTEDYKEELRHFMRILSYEVLTLSSDDIQSSGYVVDTLETAIWSFFQHDSTRSIVLEAVNLGLDTDTNGMVAGGLAGLAHGLDSIPDEWLQALAKKDEVTTLIDSFIDTALKQSQS
ncbi:MAG: ADP-ribosylglycohydrolase family protein [Chitinivibrionales bacterium]|nr:ADP-ribosylglycohydrolase family protein [Chitinivibrionales bacterium]